MFCIPSGNFRQFQQLVNICTTGKIPLADQVSAKKTVSILCAKLTQLLSKERAELRQLRQSANVF